jgi:hypothetical protein
MAVAKRRNTLITILSLRKSKKEQDGMFYLSLWAFGGGLNELKNLSEGLKWIGGWTVTKFLRDSAV